MMYYTIEKIEKQLKDIAGTIYRESLSIPRFKTLSGDCADAYRVDFDDAGWADFQVGESWGGYDVVNWFRTMVTIPDGFKGHKVALRFRVGPRDGGDSSAESLLYVDGKALQGLDIWHEEAVLPAEIVAQGMVQIAIKAWSGVLGVPPKRCFKIAELVRIDESTEAFYYLAYNLLQVIKVLDENDLRRIQLLEALNDAFHGIDFIKPRSAAYYSSMGEALGGLQSQISMLEAVKEIKPKVIGIGHSHIDMAWLWRVRHTREKASRTFSTVLNLMRQYPAYRFTHSSPQLYKFLKQDYPEIYAQVKERIARGEWEITGGMWVEADTNLTGGESLVRQFLLGTRWVKDEFGVDMKTLWLPDVFGYTGSLPQIARKCGMKHFMTTKISWSQFNRFPYDTFNWRGIDGTELLTHFVTTPEKGSRAYTYNGELTPFQVKGIWDSYRQKDVNDELILTYGWGDGGGGPTKEMIEGAQVMKNLPGLPSVEMGTAEPYFAKLEERMKGVELPVWDGELYLEYHRGTYTSQAYNKRANRRSEVLYHNAEWLSVLAYVLNGEQIYPKAELNAGWEMILLNQFHDILPGSSIHSVYEDCREDYRKIGEIGENVIAQAQKRLRERIPAEQNGLLVLNPVASREKELIEIPWSEETQGQTVRNPDGKLAGMQVSEVDGERKLLLEVSKLPALGYHVYPLAPVAEPVHEEAVRLPVELGKAGSAEIEIRPVGPAVPGSVEWERLGSSGLPQGMDLNHNLNDEPSVDDAEMIVQPDLMENNYYRIRLNERGQITSIWDKQNEREVLADGKPGNVFTAFEDKPMAFDAWDIDIYYQEKPRPVQGEVHAEVLECGPLRGRIRLSWPFYDSEISQDVIIYRHTRRIDFETKVDWHEHQVLLKVGFPVAVRSTRATYEIQFGSVERPTHWNTSWDSARFEVPGHKWADLSEGDYGVALLNDCKYGYDIKDNLMRLTLIKSGINPDPMADQGLHEFTYSLFPHAGDWRTGGVVEEAYALNNPLLVMRTEAGDEGDLPARYEFARVDADGVVIETVKKAEDDNAVIVRLYEAKQCRHTKAHLDFGLPVKKAVECNLVEQDERPVEFEGRRLRFAIQPFEIKTFKVWF